MPTGVILQSFDTTWFPIPGLSSTAPDGINFYPYRSLYDANEPTVVGSYVDGRPTVPAGVIATLGAFVHSFKDDFYNQIYVVPQSLDFGAIGSTVARTVKIWNAYLKFNANLTGVSISNAGGTYISLGSPVEIFKPLEYIDYAITAEVDGPPVIDAAYTFNFTVNAVARSYTVTVVGNRAKLLPFLPNWSEPYKVTYEYLTEIITSRSGREQRIAQRITPRKSIEFKVTVTGDKARRLNQLMSSWQHRTFVLPEVTRKVVVTAAVLSGSTAMTTPAAVDWIRAGQSILLGPNQEINEVVSVSPSGVGTTQTVVLKNIVAGDYPDGLTVWYAVSGYFAPSQAVSQYTSSTQEAALKLSVTPASEDRLDPGAAPITFNGREVFTKAPNWSSPLDLTFSHNVEELDYARGITTRFNPVDFGTQTRRATFLARSSAEAEAVVKFNDRMVGRQGEFYMSSGLPDIVISTVSNIGTTGLRVTGSEFKYAYDDDTTCRAVCVRTVTGLTIYNKVLSVDLVSDGSGGFDSLVTCLTPWTVTLNADTVLMISWMPVWRLASDTLTIEWVTDTVAQFQMSMQTLEDLPV